MIIRVRCAFRIFGRRNAGTPLAIASTPVSAAHPLANDRRMSRMKAACARLSPCTSRLTLSATGASPSNVRTSAVTSITRIDPMNR
jgi:hypothetical protein